MAYRFGAASFEKKKIARNYFRKRYYFTNLPLVAGGSRQAYACFGKYMAGEA
jgi:hypothetical protein